MPLKKNVIKVVTWVSVAYLVMSLLLPKSQILFWITALFIVFNYSLSLTYLFRQGKVSLGIIVLNVVQLALFCRLHVLIHDLFGVGHYSYTSPLYWYDWVQLVAVHVLRAVDLVDALSAYGILLQNLKHQSTLAGMTLFIMHIMVDIFLLGAIFRVINHRRFVASQRASSLVIKQSFWDRFIHRFEDTQLWFDEYFKEMNFFKLVRLLGLGLAVCLIIVVGVSHRWSFLNGVLWPLDNILRTVDFGDAFQIFGWRLHSLEMGFWLATLAVFFRLIVGFYALGLANRFYLYLLKGRGKTLEELVRICTSPQSSEEEISIAFKALLTFESKKVLPLLVNILANGQLYFRRLAAEALEKMGPAAVMATPHLVAALIDGDGDVRLAASDALDKIAPQWRQRNQKAAIPYVVKTLLESEQRQASVFALKAMGSLAKKTVPYLGKVLVTSRSREVCLAAADVLEKLGPVAAQAIPHLMIVLADSHEEVRWVAEEALNKIDSRWWLNKAANRAVPHLVKALSDRESDVRRAAAEALGSMGSAAQPAIPYLVKTLADNKNYVRKAATCALDNIDQQWWQDKRASRATPLLIKALGNSHWITRLTAVEALEKMGPAAALAITPLTKALVDGNHSVRKAAGVALGKIDPNWSQREAASRALPYIMKALTSSNAYVRWAAEDALNKFEH
jgi:HEAT repeat protein